MTFPGTPPASYPSGATQPNPRSYSSSPIAPVGPSTSSSSGTRNNKLDHIIQNFYTKTVQVIVQARVSPDSDRHGKCSSTSSTTSASSSSKNKMNKWFNIATQDAEFLREDLKYWRSRAIQSMDREPPPLILDIYLDTSDLTPNHSLMLAIDRARFNKVDLPYSTNRILLERWTLSLNHPLPDFPVDLPNLYKRSIIFFRALYSFVRLLPGHELHRRLSKYGQQLNELSLGHRLSSTIINDKSELSLDKPILDGNARDTHKYEFSDVVTPLGIFKLQVQYRKNCDFRVEDSERDLSARMMDLHEQFFTPTMDKHKQEQRPRSAVFYDEQEEASQRAVHRFSSSFAPRPSSAAAATSDSREQRQRRTSIGLRGSPTGSLKDTILSRAAQHQQQHQQQPSPIDTSTHAPITIGSPLSKRLSAPHTSPFKTPSLSSSPQAEIMFSRSGEGMIGRPQASLSDRVRSTTTMADAGSSGSMRSRIEFSPSFDKLREHTRSPSRTDLTRRWSRTSDHSSINLDMDDTGLEEFMRLAAATPELKMFQSRNYTSQFMDTDSGGGGGGGGNISPTYDNSAGGMATSGSGGGGASASIHRSKKALSHFRSLRDAHNTLSESMTSSVLARSGGGDTPSSPTTAAGMAGGVSLGSSTSSSTGRSYMPVVPSPLHATESPSSEDLRNQQHRHSDPSARIIHQRHHSLSQQQLRPGSNSSSTSLDRSPPAFASYPKDRHHDELRRLCEEDMMGDHVVSTSDGGGSGGVANHSGGSRRYRGNSLISDDAGTEIRRQESMNSLREHRTSIVDDDDSLVFKMSELGVEGGSGSGSSSLYQQQQQEAPPFAFSRTPIDPYNNNNNNARDYSQCLTIGTNPGGGGGNSNAGGGSSCNSSAANVDHVAHPTLRRIGSSTSLRQQPSSMATVVEEEEKSASSSASEDIHPTR